MSNDFKSFKGDLFSETKSSVLKSFLSSIKEQTYISSREFNYEFPINSMCITADMSYIIAGREQGKIQIIQVAEEIDFVVDSKEESANEFSPSNSLIEDELMISALQIADNCTTVIAGTTLGTIRTFDLDEPTFSAKEEHGHNGKINQITLGHDDQYFVSVSDDGKIKL